VEVNSVTLDARLTSRADLRYTPAGVPALDFELSHESVQVEDGDKRRVACEIAGVALGPVARQLAAVAPGAHLRCRGFLARRYRTGITVALHVNEFELQASNSQGN
jgi:primosomal replication protein N